MNETQNPITTTARRIARAAGQHTALYRLYFDAEGNLVDHRVGEFAHGPHGSTYTYTARGGRMAQREAQNLIDETDDLADVLDRAGEIEDEFDARTAE